MRRAVPHEIPLNHVCHSITIIVYMARHHTSSLPRSREYVLNISSMAAYFQNFLTCLKLSLQYFSFLTPARGHSFLYNLLTANFRTFSY